jgi:exodeoxyribonuclease V beta subunit
MSKAVQLGLPLAGAFAPITPFDLAGPLPAGVTLLEASAGTGKTFAIAGLAARYVADGIPLEQLLVVTFTRAATGELRDRVRERLVRTAEGLERFLASGAVDERDEVVLALTAGDRADVHRRRELLSDGVAAFDAATIDTTHGFCLHVLTGLGVSGDVDLRARLVEDVTDLVEEVVDDLYVRKFWRGKSTPSFSRTEALQIAEKVLYNPGAVVLPPPAQGPDESLLRARLAAAVLRETDRRKRAAGILTYDDLLTRLRDTLRDPQRGAAAARRLRERYKVVLVDEFQDTDLVQWEILSRAFAASGSTLVLIGDPKQSIYAFRGADVFSYLAAADKAESRHTLGVNWRSDAGLLKAFDALFGGSQLGEAGIEYRPVEAAPPHLAGRLAGAPVPAPLRIRMLARGLGGLTKKGFATAPGARAVIAQDLAADVVALLASGAELISRRADGSESDREPVRPGHIAVLVRTSTSAVTVQSELQAAGVPCVIAGAGSVFDSSAALHWLRLLEAVERPTRRDKAAAAALTPFFGWDAWLVATAGEERWEELHILLHRWSSLLRRSGAAALLEDVSASQDLPGRVLAAAGGERLLTDIRHIGQLLHEESMAESLGSAALVSWLGRRISERRAGDDNPDRSIRLESDAESVQILTIHRSKGLEFPIVYCPFAWDHWDFPIDIPVFHDSTRDGARCVDVGVDRPERRQHCDLELAEQRGEDLRLLYVALTRARHQVVMWWAGSTGVRHSAFNRLVFAPRGSAPNWAVGAGGVGAGPAGAGGAQPTEPVPDSGPPVPSDDDVALRFEALVAASGGNVSVERVYARTPTGSVCWNVEHAEPAALAAAAFDRQLDTTWRRSSFSGITALAYSEHVWSEPASDAISDEGTGAVSGGNGDHVSEAGDDAQHASEVEALPPPHVVGGLTPLALPLGEMPSGADVGTVLHKVLEIVDFASPDLVADLRHAVQTECALRQIDVGDPEIVVEGLVAALQSPLGPLAQGARLCDLTRRDRVDEMNFELPLVGGDHVAGHLTIAGLADVLHRHLPRDDPVAPYVGRLGDQNLQRELHGFLTGSLDLVFRHGGGASDLARDARYYVADYKSNRLAAQGTQLTAWHYRPEALQAEMLHAHYPLQGLLYVVALHRYLRWRVRGYVPAQHLGGVLYLFLRGMSPLAPSFGPHPCGVWSWRPPDGLVEAISDLFDRGEDGHGEEAPS